MILFNIYVCGELSYNIDNYVLVYNHIKKSSILLFTLNNIKVNFINIRYYLNFSNNKKSNKDFLIIIQFLKLIRKHNIIFNNNMKQYLNNNNNMNQDFNIQLHKYNFRCLLKIAKYFKIDINNFNRNVKISMELINIIRKLIINHNYFNNLSLKNFYLLFMIIIIIFEKFKLHNFITKNISINPHPLFFFTK